MFVCLNDTRCQECWTVDVVVGVVVDETQAVDSTSHVNINDGLVDKVGLGHLEVEDRPGQLLQSGL